MTDQQFAINRANMNRLTAGRWFLFITLGIFVIYFFMLRLIFAKQGYFKMKPSNQNNGFYEKMIRKNFDNPNEILKFLKNLAN